MATAKSAGDRRQAIAGAITKELDRQGHAALIDVAALAAAIEAALTPPPSAGEGRHPDELNATNDD